MIYTSPENEILYINEFHKKNNEQINYPSGRFCIIWNIGKTANFYIDHQLISLATNCVLFLTEINNLNLSEYSSLRVIQFNNAFYCNSNQENDFGCSGLLLYKSSNIPKIFLEEKHRPMFIWIWDKLHLELKKDNAYKLAILQNLLEHWMILSTRLFKVQHIEFINDNKEVAFIKKYNLLVEKHFKTKTKVKEYAKLLNIEPKSITNTFKKYIDRTPLQVIQERRILEAIRLLKNSNLSIKEISNELNFKDISTFSRFFKKALGISPKTFVDKF